MKTNDIKTLQQISCEVRKDVLNMTTKAQSGHPGGSLSATDIIVCLYCSVMEHDPAKMMDPDRDRFVLSKGHAAPVLYSILSRAGYFPKTELNNLRQVGGMLQGHPDMNKTPGVDMSTGSLGQGLSAANGMALAGKMDKKDYTVYCLIGDGESQEGQIWEAAMTAAHYKLDNVIAFVDNNNLQIDGSVSDVMGIEPVVDKWKAFGWHTFEVDAHNHSEILSTITQAKAIKGKPKMIIARSTKGKGVSFMENVCGFHGKTLDDAQLRDAVSELETNNSLGAEINAEEVSQ
ncbi:transketolase [Candidatus Woesearchaeota archaeon]|nr:transketolase [Candidatus Woesearchaeota archaeon]